MSIDITAKSLWFTQILHRPQRSAWNITLKLALIPIPSKMITCCQCCHSRFSNQHQSTSININITKLQEKTSSSAALSKRCTNMRRWATAARSPSFSRSGGQEQGRKMEVMAGLYGEKCLDMRNWIEHGRTNLKISPDGKATLDMRNVICKGKATENGGFGDLQ